VGIHHLSGSDGGAYLVVCDDRVDGLYQRTGPFCNEILVGLRHTEHLGNDIKRKREGQLRTDVARATRLDRIKNVVYQLLDSRA